MEFESHVVTPKSVAEAAAAVEAAMVGRKFSVLWQLDVNKCVLSSEIPWSDQRFFPDVIIGFSLARS